MIIAMGIFIVTALFFVLYVAELFFGTNNKHIASEFTLKFKIFLTFVIALLSAQYIWG